MKNSGIVRKIDDLGRIVLPKELRKHLNIKSGDDFEINIESNKIVLEKYSRLETFEEYINKIIICFLSVLNYKIFITINDMIIDNKNKINDNISKIIQERKLYMKDTRERIEISKNYFLEGKIVILPIVIDSDLLGSIIIVGNDNINNMINISKIILNLIKQEIKFD